MRAFWLAVASLLILAAPASGPQAQVPPGLMRQKLLHSQGALEAVVLEDYDALNRHAQELGALATASTWSVLATAEYTQRSVEFERAAEALAKAAQEKNVDAAALAYVEMTLKCVQCHKYVRGSRRSSLR